MAQLTTVSGHPCRLFSPCAYKLDQCKDCFESKSSHFGESPILQEIDRIPLEDINTNCEYTEGVQPSPLQSDVPDDNICRAFVPSVFKKQFCRDCLQTEEFHTDAYVEYEISRRRREAAELELQEQLRRQAKIEHDARMEMARRKRRDSTSAKSITTIAKEKLSPAQKVSMSYLQLQLQSQQLLQQQKTQIQFVYESEVPAVVTICCHLGCSNRSVEQKQYCFEHLKLSIAPSHTSVGHPESIESESKIKSDHYPGGTASGDDDDPTEWSRDRMDWILDEVSSELKLLDRESEIPSLLFEDYADDLRALLESHSDDAICIPDDAFGYMLYSRENGHVDDQSLLPLSDFDGITLQEKVTSALGEMQGAFSEAQKPEDIKGIDVAEEVVRIDLSQSVQLELEGDMVFDEKQQDRSACTSSEESEEQQYKAHVELDPEASSQNSYSVNLEADSTIPNSTESTITSDRQDNVTHSASHSLTPIDEHSSEPTNPPEDIAKQELRTSLIAPTISFDDELADFADFLAASSTSSMAPSPYQLLQPHGSSAHAAATSSPVDAQLQALDSLVSFMLSDVAAMHTSTTRPKTIPAEVIFGSLPDESARDLARQQEQQQSPHRQDELHQKQEDTSILSIEPADYLPRAKVPETLAKESCVSPAPAPVSAAQPIPSKTALLHPLSLMDTITLPTIDMQTGPLNFFGAIDAASTSTENDDRNHSQHVPLPVMDLNLNIPVEAAGRSAATSFFALCGNIANDAMRLVSGGGVDGCGGGRIDSVGRREAQKKVRKEIVVRRKTDSDHWHKRFII